MTTFLRNARVLRRMTEAHIAMSLTYRGEWLVYMAANISVPIISLLIWRTALANGAQLPIDEQFVTTYFVLLSVVTMATSSWLTTFLARDIRLGKLSSWMVRPASLLTFVANNLSEKVMKTFALLPMIGVLWSVFHDSMHVPAGRGHLALFATSVVLAAILVFTIDILVASLAFWMDDVAALHQARQLIANVLSGADRSARADAGLVAGLRRPAAVPVHGVVSRSRSSPVTCPVPNSSRAWVFNSVTFSCSAYSPASSGRPGSGATRRWAHDDADPHVANRDDLSTVPGCTGRGGMSGCGDGSCRRRSCARRTTARTS